MDPHMDPCVGPWARRGPSEGEFVIQSAQSGPSSEKPLTQMGPAGPPSGEPEETLFQLCWAMIKYSICSFCFALYLLGLVGPCTSVVSATTG